MRKWIGIVLAVLVVAVGAFALVVHNQPSKFRVVRSASVAAAPEKVFEHVDNLRKWDAWSPWAKRDPDAKNAFEGPESGEGAVFKWSGNNEVGEGVMTIAESRPNERIRIRLEFIKPFEDSADVEFAFRPDGEATVVEWSMEGENRFIAKAFCLIMNLDMERMIGDDFEAGLANLKRVVEGPKAN
jgi:carbon monoxide dehydrogenase subunit G